MPLTYLHVHHQDALSKRDRVPEGAARRTALDMSRSLSSSLSRTPYSFPSQRSEYSSSFGVHWWSSCARKVQGGKQKKVKDFSLHTVPITMLRWI